MTSEPESAKKAKVLIPIQNQMVETQAQQITLQAEELQRREANLVTVMGWFTGLPDVYNPTNAKIVEYHEMQRKARERKEKAEAAAADAQWRAEEMAKREPEAREWGKEALQREKRAREREAEILKREEDAWHAAEQAQLHLEQARLQGEELEKREKEAKEIGEVFKLRADEFKQATLNAQRRELEANARVLETQKREAEARKAADEAQKREEQVQKDLQQTQFYLDEGIQPKVWPTEEEFQLAKKILVQYDPEKLHFAVCGSSGSGKSSLINAFRGLKNNSPQAAPTGVVETTMAITRYPEELPYKRLVWYDCPSGGTLEIPGWLYFNRQGLFIFDIIVLVYDSVIISI
jgi:Interferon-inducible GTPase (IIGP)